eukprot:6388593-Prymnesium_polylepis.1
MVGGVQLENEEPSAGGRGGTPSVASAAPPLPPLAPPRPPLAPLVAGVTSGWSSGFGGGCADTWERGDAA